MKVLLVKDVYKLGRAGDVKRVADGYGRNFLLPQGLAVLATSGALKQVEGIRERANTRRSELNQEMGSLSEKLNGVVVIFAGKAGETGKLYGSITTQMIADALKEKTGASIDRHQIDTQPIRTLGEHKARVRLTVDLIPEIQVVVHREGEATAAAQPAAAEAAAPQPQVEAVEENAPAPAEEQPTEEPTEEQAEQG